MKYIRMKDGKILTVIEIIDKSEFKHSYKSLYRIKEVEKIGFDIVVDTNVSKKADTIEELCDVFVGVDKNGEHYTNPESVNDLIHMTQDILHVTLTTIYGEIWVNDELHKVAKMNEKGELELL